MSADREIPIFELAPQDPHWDRQAACFGEDWRQFYVRSSLSVDPKGITDRFCQPCPVAEDCLIEAITQGDTTTQIIAGMTPSERRPLIRQYRQLRREQLKSQSAPGITANGIVKAVANHVRKLRAGRLQHGVNSVRNTSHDSRWQGKYSKRSSVDENLVREFWQRAQPEERRAVERGDVRLAVDKFLRKF